jgi:hypothetical protein
MSEIHCRYGESNRSLIDLNAEDMIVTVYWWGWAGSIWTWLVFGKVYPINQPLQSLISRGCRGFVYANKYR